ncbi:unnamed protein product [Caenorhabditis bovis]|uniref:Regulator of microtubule dynamics protein 1 n=1 Tax=Caenorhabditis bovis TaxID=2654633 RepID=A0A8S1F7Y9_9PELO|nr:unnamed protein product [Caenorhabditis bovis]
MSFENVDTLYENQQFQKGFDELKLRYKSGEDTCEVLWRMCRFCHDISNMLTGEQKKHMVFEGRNYGLRAVDLDPACFMAAKWAAILYGISVDMMSMKDKINEGGKLKDLLDKALELDPTDFALLHLRARFSFTLANLSWLERNEVPKASIDDALADFEAAYKSQEDWIENLLYLAKCLVTKKEKARARELLNKALQLPADSNSDQELQSECKKLLEKC